VKGNGKMISVQDIEYCKVKVNYKADLEKINSVKNNIIKNFKNMKVPGFRTGKASDQAIFYHYKSEINNAVKNELINQSNDDILFETKIRPIGQPQIKSVFFDGKIFECEIVYSKKPDFELKQYKELEVVDPHMDSSVEEITESTIQELRNQFSEVRAYSDDDFIQDGDKVTLSYRFEDGTEEEGTLYTVGSNGFPGFDQNIYGMSPGDERDFQIELNGKVQKCHVQFHMGMKKSPAELNDSLAIKVGLQNIDELYVNVKAMSEQQFKAQKDAKIADQIIKILCDSHEIVSPEWIVELEAQQLTLKEGQKFNELDDNVKKHYLEKAEKNVKLAFILDSIQMEEPESKISENEALQLIHQNLTQRGIKAQEWMENAAKNGMLQGVLTKFRNDFTIQWLVDNCKKIS
jgi:trigger factor